MRPPRPTSLTATTALVVALVLAGLAVLALVRPPEDGRPGVPDRLSAVPDHVVAYDGRVGDYASDETVTSPAVGSAAAAWLHLGVLVLVDARTGDYHLVDTDPVVRGRVALSPDGDRLLHEASLGALAVTDLRSGETSYLRDATPQRPAGLTQLDWSVDGRWIAWSGPGSAGRSELGTGRLDEVRSPESSRPGRLTVADDGTVLLVDRRGITRWKSDGAISRSGRLPDDLRGAAGFEASPDGSLVAVGSCCDATAYVVDARTGATAWSTRLDHDGSARVQPTGWLDGDTALWQEQHRDGSDGHLWLVRSEAAEQVGVVDAELPGRVSVATGLMTAGRPTVERATPDWPWSPTHKLLVAGLAALVLAAALATVAVRRQPAPDADGRPRSWLALPELAPLWAVAAFVVSFGWMALVAVLGPAPEALWAPTILAGPVASAITGVVMLLVPGRRWAGVGLVVGPIGAVLLGLYLLVRAIGS